MIWEYKSKAAIPDPIEVEVFSSSSVEELVPVMENHSSEDFINPLDFEVSSRQLRSNIIAYPLIQVCNVTIRGYTGKPSNIFGEIDVVDSKEEIYQLFNQPNGKTLPKLVAPANLLLTGPKTGVIPMDGALGMNINLYIKSAELKNHNKLLGFVQGRLKLNTKTKLCYSEAKSSTLESPFGAVDIHYIAMPCAVIADVKVIFTKKGQFFEEYDSDKIDADTSDRHDADISGIVIVCYDQMTCGEVIESESCNCTSIVLLKTRGMKCERVAYGIPVKFSRSLVCVPAYSSLTLKFCIALEDCGEKKKTVFQGSKEFEICDEGTTEEYLSVGNFGMTVKVKWLNPDDPDLILKKEKSGCIVPQSCQPPVSYSRLIRVPPNIPLFATDRVQVLSVFVGHEGGEKVDLCGTIGVEFIGHSTYIFRRDKKCPDSLSRRGQAVSLKGLTTYPGDYFSMCLKLKDTRGHVEIDDALTMYYACYDINRQWFNKPLCSIQFGKRCFAAVHFILFDRAVKATVKFCVILKDSASDSDLLPDVYGSVVAQYSNYQYSTRYERKYWRVVLFEEKGACNVTGDGEIPLSSNVVSVPKDSSLVVDVNLYARVASSIDIEHFMQNIEIKIGDVESQKIKGQNYDVVVTTKWESGSEF